MKDIGHVWRPIRKDDSFRLARLEQLCSQQDGAAHPYGDHGWNMKLEHAADLAKDGVVTVDGNGDVLAFALVTYELRPHEAHAYLDGRVIPALRRRGVGTALIEWSGARAGEHLDTIADGRTKVVRVLSYDGGPDAVALYERRGLRLQFAEHELRLVLDDAIPRMPWPPSSRSRPTRRMPRRSSTKSTPRASPRGPPSSGISSPGTTRLPRATSTRSSRI